MKKPYVSPRAFSRDGYIVDQRLLKNLPYGMKQSNYNGCGWVAAYNFLRACGRKKEYDTVRQQLEDSLIFGGLVGTHIIQLYLYLRRHGFHLYWAWGREAALKKVQQWQAYCFILMARRCILSLLCRHWRRKWLWRSKPTMPCRMMSIWLIQQERIKA